VPDPIAMSGIVPPVAATPAAQAAPAAAPAAGKSFQSVLLESLDEVNRLQAEADEGVQRLMTGQTDNVAEVLAAVNKAGIAFDLLMEIRNKLVESYKEIEQMQV